jgi:hypothetical protein
LANVVLSEFEHHERDYSDAPSAFVIPRAERATVGQRAKRRTAHRANCRLVSDTCEVKLNCGGSPLHDVLGADPHLSLDLAPEREIFGRFGLWVPRGGAPFELFAVSPRLCSLFRRWGFGWLGRKVGAIGCGFCALLPPICCVWGDLGASLVFPQRRKLGVARNDRGVAAGGAQALDAVFTCAASRELCEELCAWVGARYDGLTHWSFFAGRDEGDRPRTAKSRVGRRALSATIAALAHEGPVCCSAVIMTDPPASQT